MKRFFLTKFLFIVALSSPLLFATLYEDGTNQGWHIESSSEDAGLVSTNNDPQEDSVVRLNSIDTALFLGGYKWDKSLRWNNLDEKFLKITFKTTDKFDIVVLVENEAGENRYLHYWEVIDLENTVSAKQISLNQNTRDGNWHTIERDLEKDLGEKISKVNGILIRRSNMDIASIELKKSRTTYEDGTNQGWHLESTEADDGRVTTAIDPEKGNIVKLNSIGTGLFLGGYRWDNGLRWENEQNKNLKITFRSSDEFDILAIVQNENGENRYIHYWEETSEPNSENAKHISLHQNTRDGQWHTIERNLEKDLGESISKVEGIIVRCAHVDIASLELFSPLEDNGTLYEDAEDGESNRWSIYNEENSPSGASISNVYDPTRGSRVIQFEGDGVNNWYQIESSWNNQTDKLLKFSLKFDENFLIYVQINTTKGNRMLRYSTKDSGEGMIEGSREISHGLSASANDGKWHTFARNLERDLQRYDRDNELISVNRLFVRGDGMIDDIGLYHELNSVHIDRANSGIRRGGVVFSFDDRPSINSWYEARNLFQSNNISATFFIDHWHMLSETELSNLRDLQSDGHEIASHSYSHISVFDSRYDSETDKAESYLEDQIIPSINNMKADGFNPVSFAYPYTRYTGSHNAKIKPYLPAVRCFLSNTMGIDKVHGNSIEDIRAKLESVKENREIVTFIAHQIVPTGEEQTNDYSIKIELLEEVINEAKALGLEFYQFNEAYRLSKVR